MIKHRWHWTAVVVLVAALIVADVVAGTGLPTRQERLSQDLALKQQVLPDYQNTLRAPVAGGIVLVGDRGADGHQVGGLEGVLLKGGYADQGLVQPGGCFIGGIALPDGVWPYLVRCRQSPRASGRLLVEAIRLVSGGPLHCTPEDVIALRHVGLIVETDE